MIGQSINHYRITAKLGQGGMGEVYRATDTRLNRQVALKVLPPAFADDEQRMARFEREAQVLASLNHPNIASTYGLEETNGTRVLVMEMVEGEDLSERIARGGPIPPEEALPIALQIAEALENAHAKGIVHRDLKPANVKITPDGGVKVLDFGLAKALDPIEASSNSSANDLANSPTALATVPGLILGTAAYMSPEQARGKPVDKRSDIWSFGVLLWEMLTGKPLYGGETLTDVLASVVETKEINLDTLPQAIPPSVRNLLKRCLRKDPRRRLPDIGAARLELQEVLAGASPEIEASQPKVEETVQTKRRRRWLERWAWASVVVALTGLCAFLVFQRVTEATEPRAVTHFVLDTPPDLTLGDFVPTVVSPDGRSIVFVGAPADAIYRLWLRRLEAPEIRALTGTEGAIIPFWSPDSASIAFAANGDLKKLVLASGTIQRICALPQDGFNGGTWNRDGVIVFSTGAGTSNLYSVSAGGGDPKLLMPHDESRGEKAHFDPQFLPDGQHLIFVIYSSKEGNSGLFVISLERPRERRRILPSQARSVFAPSGHLLFVREGTLQAQPFDATRLTTTGGPTTVASGVGAWSGDSNEGSFSVSPTGVVSWMSEVVSDVQLEWIGRKGEQIAKLGEPRRYGQIALSPDDRRVAVELGDASGRFDLWVMDVTRGVASRITTDPANERDPVWSPDSQELVFSSDARGDQDLLRKSLLGSEPAVPLRRGMGQTHGERDVAEYWCRQGNTLLFTTIGKERTVWAAALDGEKPPEALMKSRFPMDEPQVSPDGRWLAYMSTESGRYEIYLAPFRRRGESVRVSTSGGGQPKWRGDGKELFYLSLDRAMMAVDVREGATGPEIGIPVVLVPANELRAVVQGPDYDDYAVVADGQRFLVKRRVAESSAQRIHVLLNWPSLLP